MSTVDHHSQLYVIATRCDKMLKLHTYFQQKIEFLLSILTIITGIMYQQNMYFL